MPTLEKDSPCKVNLLLNILGDFTYTLIDPRIDFARRA